MLGNRYAAKETAMTQIKMPDGCEVVSNWGGAPRAPLPERVGAHQINLDQVVCVGETARLQRTILESTAHVSNCGGAPKVHPYRKGTVPILSRNKPSRHADARDSANA